MVRAIERLERRTEGHRGMFLNIAMGYGGREEIVDAVKRLLLEAEARGLSPKEVAEGLTPEDIARHLYTAGLPDPDFIIRTSGRSGFPASSSGSPPTPSSTSPTSSGPSSARLTSCAP